MKTALLVVASISLLAEAGYADESLSLNQILTRHDATIERLQRCSVKSRERWANYRAGEASQPTESIRTCEIRVDGERVNLLIHEELVDPDGVSRHSNEFNYVRNGHVLRIFYPHETYNVRPKGPGAVHGRLAAEADDEMFLSSVVGAATVIFGTMTFPNPAPTSKLIGTFKNVSITRDEIGCCVSGTGQDGTRHKVWFDPDASYVVKQLVSEQTGEALNENRFQFNRRVLKSRYGFDDKAVVKSVVFEIRNVKSAPWKDVHVVTDLEAVKTITTTDGQKAQERMLYTLTDWNLDPDFSDPMSFRPLLPVAEGARVLVEETPSLEYAYLNDQIRLAVNERTIADLEKVRMLNQPYQPKMQWIWGLVSAVLALSWWKLRSQAA